MTEIIPGLYQLKLELPGSFLEYVNVYLIKQDSNYLLVDTGWNNEETFDSLKAQLAELGVTVSQIKQIVLTHIHHDHCGLAGTLKELSHASIALHAREKDAFAPRYLHMEGLLQKMRQWLRSNGVPSGELPQLQMASAGWARFVAPIEPDITLHGGETIASGEFSFKVIWTPGHSPGHVCLFEPDKKILISGDHILPVTTPNIGLHPQSEGNPLGDFIGSLKSLRSLDVNLVLPGHEKIFTGFKERIDQLLRHHEQRSAEILGILGNEPKTAYHICLEMTWMPDQGGVRGSDLAPWTRRMAVMETLAHLELLRVDGKVDNFLKKDVVSFQIKYTV